MLGSEEKKSKLRNKYFEYMEVSEFQIVDG